MKLILSKLNCVIKKIITAVAQSKLVGVMLDELNETELWFYKTGRNARNTHHSRSANAVDYRRATGLECLYGYLYISGQHERARELFRFAVEKSEFSEE